MRKRKGIDRKQERTRSTKNLFTPGTDTSSSIIEWAIAEMLKNPNILTRVQKEMDQVIGRQRLLAESEIPNLPYLQAICKETYRMHPSTPLSVPRVATEACLVNGFYIPKNTRLSVNIWAIGRDPNVWSNPLEFNPERFLGGKNTEIDPSGVDSILELEGGYVQGIEWPLESLSTFWALWCMHLTGNYPVE
ncbi:hypothetical protein Fmac_026745 [Flemingia macrophylla]|uniref:Cytochrome P450 n=1 Tax=Flemingia macrophylla TaxID=520843 RepID=A0ABD1LFW4_9FABA